MGHHQQAEGTPIGPRSCSGNSTKESVRRTCNLRLCAGREGGGDHAQALRHATVHIGR